MPTLLLPTTDETRDLEPRVLPTTRWAPSGGSAARVAEGDLGCGRSLADVGAAT